MPNPLPMSEVAGDGDFQAAIAGQESLVLVFHGTWCGPCKAYKSVVDQARGNTGGVKFVRVDIDRTTGATGQYNIKTVPTTVLVHKGREVARLSGVQTAQGLLDVMKQKFV